MKKYIFLSAFALEKEQVASSRIYGLTKSLKKLGNEIVLCSPNVSVENVFVYDFIDKFLCLPIKENPFLEKIRKIYKKNKIYEQNNNEGNNFRLYKNVHSLIHNNILWYDHFYCRAFKQYLRVKYSNRLLKKIALELSNFSTILITSSGPSIMNYFGYKIKKRNPNIFWVADYRDLNQNNPSKSDKFNFRGKKMDKLAFKYADLITTVSYGAKEQNIENAKKMGFDIRNKSYVLYNGFSLENNSLELSSKEELKSLFVDKDKIYIVYTGTIYSLQKIEYFLKVLADSQQLKFIYAGNSHQLIDVYVQKFNLEDKVINLGFVKKEEAEYLQKKADILLLLKLIDGNKDKGIMTGKFYEYLTKNKKIMVIGDQDEEFNEICKNLKNVDILPYDKDIIAEYLNNLKKEDLKENYDPNIERFSWETLAKEFDDFISQKLKEWKSTT